MHADDGHRLRRLRAIDVLEVDHRFAAVRVALGARLHAGLAADAAVRVDEEVQLIRLRHGLDRYAAWSVNLSARCVGSA